MDKRKLTVCDDLGGMAETRVSRRTAVVMLGLLTGSALCHEQIDEEAIGAVRKGATSKPRS